MSASLGSVTNGLFTTCRLPLCVKYAMLAMPQSNHLPGTEEGKRHHHQPCQHRTLGPLPRRIACGIKKKGAAKKGKNGNSSGTLHSTKPSPLRHAHTCHVPALRTSVVPTPLPRGPPPTWQGKDGPYMHQASGNLHAHTPIPPAHPTTSTGKKKKKKKKKPPKKAKTKCAIFAISPDFPPFRLHRSVTSPPHARMPSAVLVRSTPY